LQRLLVVVLVGRVLHDNGVVSFADLPPLLGLGLPLLRDLDFLRGRRRLGDELLQVILQDTSHQHDYSHGMGTRHGVRLLTSFGGRAAEYSEMGHAVYGGMSLKIRASLSIMLLSSTSSPGIRDVSSSPVYSNPRVSRDISGCTVRFMKLKATCSALSPASLSALIRANNFGSVFHHGRCLGCFPLGFGNPGWWFVM
jgi:hypothetical protein